MLDLYWLTADDPDTGASVLATLEAAAEFGLGGMRPVRLRPPISSSIRATVALSAASAPPSVAAWRARDILGGDLVAGLAP